MPFADGLAGLYNRPLSVGFSGQSRVLVYLQIWVYFYLLHDLYFRMGSNFRSNIHAEASIIINFFQRRLTFADMSSQQRGFTQAASKALVVVCLQDCVKCTVGLNTVQYRESIIISKSIAIAPVTSGIS